MSDDFTIPDFLNRKLNPSYTTPEEMRAAKRLRSDRGIVWPKKRNWRKIEQRRREQEKKENAALQMGAFRVRKGQ